MDVVLYPGSWLMKVIREVVYNVRLQLESKDPEMVIFNDCNFTINDPS